MPKMTYDPNDYKIKRQLLQMTGFRTMAEYKAYELGRKHEQDQLLLFIKQWKGDANSQVGIALKLKFAQLKIK